MNALGRKGTMKTVCHAPQIRKLPSTCRHENAKWLVRPAIVVLESGLHHSGSIWTLNVSV